ncbi:MAG: hypothetical protein L0Y44_10370 [Phycisphaerales bacterium]|nr:hypothetical protein [Phycisphaerales bacterium]MCI0631042.1 hypothetical protein [Phycisphaerales bacterium]MCI0675744.1 hypothetical protein [Phycisphaerales bacterium]
MVQSAWLRAGIFFVLTALAGCSGDQPLNPSFALSMTEAEAAWRDMEANPKPLERPVIVLGGIYDPGIVTSHVKGKLRGITTDDSKILSLSFFQIHTFDHCARKVIDAVDRAFGAPDPDRTVEVDVVAFSMGGIIARHAAAERTGNGGVDRRLRIARLFTISTPHRGANFAWISPLDPRAVDMRMGSQFLRSLNAAECDYQIIPYARLGDMIVGEANSAPPGRDPWWLANPMSLAHGLAGHDVRFLVDIGRRLRNEPPFTSDPAAPIP